jgi:repressor LexA
VTKHVDALVKKGFLATDPRIKRNIRLTEQGWKALGMDGPRDGVPVIGAIAAGSPILAEENRVDLLRDVAPAPGRFALQVRGDSMIGVGIQDGDYAVIDSAQTLRDGRIGAVLVDEQATLKRVRIAADRVTLIAENPAYPPREIRGAATSNLRLLGPLVLVVRIVS